MTMERLRDINAELAALATEHEQQLVARTANPDDRPRANDRLAGISQKRSALEVERQKLKKALVAEAAQLVENLSAHLLKTIDRNGVAARGRAAIGDAQRAIEKQRDDFINATREALANGQPLNFDLRDPKVLAFLLYGPAYRALTTTIPEMLDEVAPQPVPVDDAALGAAQQRLAELRDL